MYMYVYKYIYIYIYVHVYNTTPQYASLVERFVPSMTDLLRDPSELLRKHAATPLVILYDIVVCYIELYSTNL